MDYVPRCFRFAIGERWFYLFIWHMWLRLGQGDFSYRPQDSQPGETWRSLSVDRERIKIKAAPRTVFTPPLLCIPKPGHTLVIFETRG